MSLFVSCSDVDLVVTGLVQPDSITGGFSPKDKRLVSSALERIAAQLRRYGQRQYTYAVDSNF